MPAWTIEGALRSVARPSPLTVTPETSLRELLATCLPKIESRGDGAIVVVDPATGIPLGVLTPVDLLRQIGIEGVPAETPVAALMTSGVATVAADAPIQRAATVMVRRNVHHVVLTEPDGAFAGLVAQADLYTLDASLVEQLVYGIGEAADIATLGEKSRRIRSLAARLLDDGVRADAICHWLSTLNDLVALQAIEIVESSFSLPAVPWSWLLFGSEGRYEQTLFTDQDNGIIFVPDAANGAAGERENALLRAAFLPFARAVNEALDQCGFPLCPGQIMASNEKWCLSLDEWKQRFVGWLRQPEPDALLNATIFFDFRALHGPDEPARQLRDALFAESSSSALCLRLMAANALDVSPPLSKWRSAFLFDDAGRPGTIDLKKYGSRLFVDAIRVMALAEGVPATGTVSRLREIDRRLGLAAGNTAGTIEAFYVLQRLRLEHQCRSGEHQPADENRVRPEDLSEIDRQLLREALLQARRLQQRVRLRWQLD